MSETSTEQPTPEAPAQEPSTEQPKVEEIDWKAKAREWEKRAKDNKSAAEKLAAIETENQTEAEKQAARLAEAEQRATALEVKATRAEVASETGIPAAILAGPEDGSPEALEAFAKLVLAYTEQTGKPRAPKVDPNQGRQGSSGPKTTADSFTEFFRNNLPER